MADYRFLVLGAGGREHTLAWALANSKSTKEVYTAPGNPGTAQVGTNLSISLSDFEAIAEKCKDLSIDVVIVGPEQPLVDGITDYLKKEGISVFGPDEYSAQLEGSKEFAKNVMENNNVPTAAYATFDFSNEDAIVSYINQMDSLPIVLKADGLAAGKGVFICESKEEAISRLQYIKNDKNLAKASTKLVIEEFLKGEEASVFAICDGENYKVLTAAQDHKRIGENDTGLNTGGMGAYTPAPLVTVQVMSQVKSEIIEPMLKGMKDLGHPYVGVLYCGLMIDNEKASVVEFNCRFGDPECEVILPMIKTDFAEMIVHAVNQKLDQYHLEFHDEYRCTVVLASKGYPEAYEKGKVIMGLDSIAESHLIFHAGTKEHENQILTNGGRVLNCVGKGDNLKDAINHAYQAVEKIDFEGVYFRKDIGQKGLS